MSLRLLHSGNEFFDVLADAIHKAKIELHLQTYMLVDDAAGNEIIDALILAVKRGVKVYLLIDHHGSSAISDTAINKLIKNGVNLRIFSPPFTGNSVYMGRRLHHKLLAVDYATAIIGGVNIALKYKGTAKTNPWLDYAVIIENESICADIHSYCRKIYFKNFKLRLPRRKIKKTSKLGRFLVNDYIRGRNQIQNAYIKAIKKTKTELYIINSYFLPGRKLMKALLSAAKRGVHVKLILPGISDVPILKRAAKYLYKTLFNYNIEIYEWEQSILHAKVALSDDQWATVGSFNLNLLSTLGSLEANIEVVDKQFIFQIKNELNIVIAKSAKIERTEFFSKLNRFTYWWNYSNYIIISFGLYLITVLPSKRFLKKYLME